MVFSFYYIDVVSLESLAEFEQRLVMIAVNMFRDKIANNECQLIATTNQSLLDSRSNEKLNSLNKKLSGANVSIFSPLTASSMNALFSMSIMTEDVTKLGRLYLILHYVQAYVSQYQNQSANFHFYGSEQQVGMLSTIFCDHGRLTNVLIPQHITLSLHAWSDPLRSFFKKVVIKGSCAVQFEYKPLLSHFSTVIKQLPQNIFVYSTQLQSNAHIADVEQPKKRIKISSCIKSKPTGIVFPIGLDEMKKLQKLGKERQFTYHRDALEEQRLDILEIDIVAVLKSSSKNLGVFAKKAISKGQLLGSYMGKKVSLYNTKQNTDYLFELNEFEGVNALKSRNWTAFVNSSRASMNVVCDYAGGELKYKSIKKIAIGEQLLLDYGPEYDFDHDGAYRYLKSSDTRLDSEELITNHPMLYCNKAQQLPATLAQQLRVANETYFKIPCYDFFMQNNTLQPDVNAVLLAMDDSNNLPIRQELQENITALMYACVNQEQALVTYLLDHGACPNIQSSIQGYTALHLVCLSSHPLHVKNTLITLLRSKGARVDLCEKNKQSVIQLAQEHAPELSPQLTAKWNIGGRKKAKQRGRFFSANDHTLSIAANEDPYATHQLGKN